MKTIRRLLYRDIAASVAFVSVAFLSLFFFIDVVEYLGRLGKPGYTVWTVLRRSLLELPSHLYELLPITTLIGTIYALARLAQTSEFTILRTSGLGPLRALRLLAVLGLVFSALTFAVGEYLVPAAEHQAAMQAARNAGGLKLERNGVWLRERRSTPEGERQVAVNVAAAADDGLLLNVRLYEFDAEGRLTTRVQADRGSLQPSGHWLLQRAKVERWPLLAAAAASAPAAGQQVTTSEHEALAWPTTLSASVVAAAVLPLDTMGALDLWRYSAHLSLQEQAAQRYQIRFWKKAVYPLACLVMMALALPFAYLHARAGGVSLKVFGGVMLGISFVLVNNVSGHLGLLRDWTPWLVATAPSLFYLLLSMAAFTWLVRYR